MMAPSMRMVLGAALASGLLLWAASPTVGAGWLAWVALVPVAALSLSGAGTRAGRLAVPLAYLIYLELLLIPAFPFGLTEGQWGDPVVPVLVGDSPVLALALLAAPLVGALLYLVRFGAPWGLARLPSPLAPTALVLSPALAWTALDFARAKLDPGALWGPLFLSQADQPPGEIAALGGPWLITLAIVAVNYGIAAVAVRRRPGWGLVPVPAAVALAALGTWAQTEVREPGLRVAAIQPGYDTAEEDRPELRRFRRGTYDLAALDLIRDLGELTEQAVEEGAALVVWPEAAMYVDPREEPEVREALERLAQRTGARLVVPFFHPRPAAAGEVLAVVPSPGGGRLTEARPKHRPHWIIGERRAPGETGPIEAGGVTVGPLLGTDHQDARNAAGLVADGAELLVSSTHDWRQSAVPASAYAQLASRAAGAPFVRADWRYGSAIYDGSEAAADAGTDRARSVLVAEVRPAARPTAYARLGDLVGWLAVAFAALAGLAAAVRLGPGPSGGLSRGDGRGGGGRGPGRGSPPRPPSP